MRLTTKGRYAVMAMAELARSSTGKPVSLGDIADRQAISLSYLEQLFAKLRRGDLVNALRGPGGGYLLNRAPEEITVAEIISAVDETIQTTRCELGADIGCQAGGERCLTHDLWFSLGEHIRDFLNRVTLADVLSGAVVDRPDLRAPEAAQPPLASGQGLA